MRNIIERFFSQLPVIIGARVGLYVGGDPNHYDILNVFDFKGYAARALRCERCVPILQQGSARAVTLPSVLQHI